MGFYDSGKKLHNAEIKISAWRDSFFEIKPIVLITNGNFNK